MAATVGISRVYLNEDGQGVITCRHCDVQRPIRTSQHLHESIHWKLVKTKCKSCESIFMCDSIAEDTQEFLCIF